MEMVTNMAVPGAKALEPQRKHKPGAEEQKQLRANIMHLAGPSLAELLMMNMLQTFLMMMVGRVGPEAVTVIGLTNQPVLFSLALFNALNIGTTAIIARSIGAGKPGEANHAAQQTLLLNLVLSILISAMTFLFAKEILVFMGAEPAVVAEGIGYSRIMFLSLSFTTLSLSMSAMLRGAGDTRTPMRVNIISSIIVVVTGFPLIYGMFGLPAFGVTGAAIANVIGKLLSAAWMTYVLFGGKFAIQLSFKKLWILNRSMLARLMHIGIPSAGEQFALRAGQLVLTLILATQGTAVFAAHTITFSILTLSSISGMAFSMAASTAVGQALGSKQPELAERYGREAVKIGNKISGAAGILFLLFAPYIMMLYTTDPEVIAYGTIALRMIGLVQIPQSSQYILAGALRGAGDAKFTLISTFVGVTVVRASLSALFVLGFQWGIAGAYAAVVSDQLVRTLLIFSHYRKGRWKNTRV